jgi:hypothetical protein
MSRVFRAVHLQYRLASPYYGVTPTTQDKRWYFELSSARDNEAGWAELLHRIFYDYNVQAQRREPSDVNWLTLDSFDVTPVNARKTLDWPGVADQDHAERYMPWQLGGVVWEPAICWWIDDNGRYDALEGNDYCELIAYRLFDAGQVDQATLIGFLNRLYTKSDFGSICFADRVDRLANLACVRPTHAFRKSPDAPPITSGPPTPAHLAG